jgi:uncharacterized protein
MTLHESEERLSPQTLETNRALRSLIEELDAIGWYQQRTDATQDAELRSILEHNGNEEREHAAMALEWIRRRDPVLDEKLRLYLFTDGPLVGIERAAEGKEGGAAGPVADSGAAGDGSLGIGGLRGEAHR